MSNPTTFITMFAAKTIPTVSTQLVALCDVYLRTRQLRTSRETIVVPSGGVFYHLKCLLIKSPCLFKNVRAGDCERIADKPARYSLTASC